LRKKKRMNREEREAAYAGRLATPDLRAVFEEELYARQRGTRVDVSDLAIRYGVDKDILEQVLRHCALPAVGYASDGRLIAKPLVEDDNG
jgi:hypothetical protein